MCAMSEPAYTTPDDDGTFHLLVDGERKTFRVEHDDRGRSFLCEILPWESVPEHIRRAVEDTRDHPERLVRMTLDDLDDLED